MKSASPPENINPVPYRADFTKPLEFLFQCHHKIASNLVDLIRVTEELRPVETFEAAPVLERVDTVLKYLSSAGAKHTLDEEESLFPRLRAHGDSGVSELFDVIEQLEAQHKRAASIERSLEKMLRNFETIELLDENRIALFKDLAESLYDLYRPHIQMENEFVFPTSGKILTGDELLAIGKELFNRRQINL